MKSNGSSASSSKNIVIFFDGTGNFFRTDLSNVVKMYRVIQRGTAGQIAYYDPGVGTFPHPSRITRLAKRVSMILGLAFGRGLMKNVEEAYSFLMDQYEVGDKIFLFGFSRGAFTARVLAGFIHACGLLDKRSQNLIQQAISLFNMKAPMYFESNPKRGNKWELIPKFKYIYGRNRFLSDKKSDQKTVQIHFMGLWDTVSTFGRIFKPIYFAYTENNKSVKVVRHALSIDERRTHFPQMMWTYRPPKQQDVKQVWFAGTHSDIGGGFAEEESGLSKISLKWMLQEAIQAGLIVDQDEVDYWVDGLKTKDQNNVAKPNHLADQHKSLKSWWWVVQFLPRDVWNAEKPNGFNKKGEPTNPGRKALKFPCMSRSIKDDKTLRQTIYKDIIEFEEFKVFLRLKDLQKFNLINELNKLKKHETFIELEKIKTHRKFAKINYLEKELKGLGEQKTRRFNNKLKKLKADMKIQEFRKFQQLKETEEYIVLKGLEKFKALNQTAKFTDTQYVHQSVIDRISCRKDYWPKNLVGSNTKKGESLVESVIEGLKDRFPIEPYSS